MTKLFKQGALALSVTASALIYTGCNGNDSGESNISNIMNNVAVADVVADGWTECYKATYAESGDDLDTMINVTCDGAEIMLACRETDSNTLRVAAWANHDDVFYETGNSGQGGDITHIANGVAWYFEYDMSMGFSPVDVPIYLWSADGYDVVGGPEEGAWDELTNNQKLSWHTDSGNMDNGWRCGDVITGDSTQGSAGWEKIIYQRD